METPRPPRRAHVRNEARVREREREAFLRLLSRLFLVEPLSAKAGLGRVLCGVLAHTVVTWAHRNQSSSYGNGEELPDSKHDLVFGGRKSFAPMFIMLYGVDLC